VLDFGAPTQTCEKEIVYQFVFNRNNAAILTEKEVKGTEECSWNCDCENGVRYIHTKMPEGEFWGEEVIEEYCVDE
jgi:hypothetical protein